jgi:hypothetical protein
VKTERKWKEILRRLMRIGEENREKSQEQSIVTQKSLKIKRKPLKKKEIKNSNQRKPLKIHRNIVTTLPKFQSNFSSNNQDSPAIQQSFHQRVF